MLEPEIVRVPAGTLELVAGALDLAQPAAKMERAKTAEAAVSPPKFFSYCFCS
jgi:hypothetical protein